MVLTLCATIKRECAFVGFEEEPAGTEVPATSSWSRALGIDDQSHPSPFILAPTADYYTVSI